MKIRRSDLQLLCAAYMFGNVYFGSPNETIASFTFPAFLGITFLIGSLLNYRNGD